MSTTGKVVVSLEAQSSQLKKETAAAKEELTGYGKFAANVKTLGQESRQTGESSIERMLKGAGALGLATFAMEGLGKAAESTSKNLRMVADGEETVGQAIGSVLSDTADAVPVLGTFVKAFRSIEDAGWDSVSALAQWAGMSKETADTWLTSSASIQAEADKLNKAMDAVREMAKGVHEEFAKSGASEKQAQELKAEEDFQKQKAELEKKYNEATKGIDQSSSPGRQMRSQYLNAIKELEEAHGNDMARLHDKENTDELVQLQTHQEKMKQLIAEGLRSKRDPNASKAISDDYADNELKYQSDINNRMMELEKSSAGKTAEEKKKLNENALDEIAQMRKNWQAADEASYRESEKRKKDQNVEAWKDIISTRTDLLKQQGELGDDSAKYQAERLEKYSALNDKQEELNNLLKEDKDLTAGKRQEIEKLIDQLGKAKNAALETADPLDTRKAAAVTRRNDFDIQSYGGHGGKTHGQTAKEHLEVAKKQEQHGQKIEWYQQQLYNYQLNNQTGSSGQTTAIVLDP